MYQKGWQMASARSSVRNQYLANSIKWQRKTKQGRILKGEGEEREKEKELLDIEGKGDNGKGGLTKTNGD